MLSSSQSDLSDKDILLNYFSDKKILGIVVIFLILRFILVLISPQFTTDLARSIFYGQQFWKHGFDVYKLTPIQLDPNFNIIDPTTGQLAWPKNKYDYGLVSILFYSLIGLLPLPDSVLIVITKIMFNFIDIITFSLLIVLFPKNKEIPLLFWIIMLPFTSIEGQALSVTILFFTFSLYFYNRNKKVLAYCIIAIGFHWKYVSLFLLPYYIINDLWLLSKIENKSKGDYFKILKPVIYFLVIIILLMFPILVSPYILSYLIFEGNLPVGHSQPWNPYYIGLPWTISAFLLVFFIFYIIFVWYRLDNQIKEAFLKGAGFIPLLGLYIFLLIYKYAFPWYWLWSIPFYAILPTKTRKIFGIFVVLCLVAAIEFINWTVGFPFITNYLFVFKT